MNCLLFFFVMRTTDIINKSASKVTLSLSDYENLENTIDELKLKIKSIDKFPDGVTLNIIHKDSSGEILSQGEIRIASLSILPKEIEEVLIKEGFYDGRSIVPLQDYMHFRKEVAKYRLDRLYQNKKNKEDLESLNRKLGLINSDRDSLIYQKEILERDRDRVLSSLNKFKWMTYILGLAITAGLIRLVFG